MNEELKRLIILIDELETEVWRQNQQAVDPKLKDWTRLQATALLRMQEELESYIQKVETAGNELK